MAHWRGLLLSISGATSAPSTARVAAARSAPRPTSTADTVTGAPRGTLVFAEGWIVRTMGGDGAGDADATAAGEGPAASPGEGLGRGRSRGSLAERVGGTAGVAVGLSPPRRGPRHRPGGAPRPGGD